MDDMFDLAWLLLIIPAYLMIHPFQLKMRVAVDLATDRGHWHLSVGSRGWSVASSRLYPDFIRVRPGASGRRALRILRWMRCADRLDLSVMVHVRGADAARTALSVGAVWAAFGGMEAALRAAGLPLGQMRVAVEPDFTGGKSQLTAHCIGRVRPGRLILNLMRI